MSIVIAGGGLAGAATACLLARAGRDVTVIERSTGPHHKICGEFLSIEAQNYLSQLGLEPASLGGHTIDRLRIVRGETSILTKLPFRGFGLTRYRLDEALLAHAATCGATIRRGETVTDVEGVTFLATGKHDLRPSRRELVEPPEELVGFKMYFKLSAAQQAALAGTVEVILFEGGYGGLQMVEDNQANLCLLVHRARLAEAGGTWHALLSKLLEASSHLKIRLTDAQPLLDRPLTIARVPYGHVHRPKAGETLFRLGDQACVIPSFSGDGMALSMHSAALASRLYLEGRSAEHYHRALARDVSGPINRAMLLYRLGGKDPGQSWILRATSLLPSLLRVAARYTRVPHHALLSA